MMIDVEIDRTLYPFQSRWFSSSAGRVHYVDEGSGPPILFCHGSPTWSFLFRNVITRLRGAFRCIALDCLGFGLSERPDEFGYTVAEHSLAVGELIDHLQLGRFVIAGHDWGGPIGLAAATSRADRVVGVALTDTALWPIDALPNRVFSRAMSTRSMQRRIVENNVLVERVLLGRAGPPMTPDEADHYRRVQPPGARAGLAVIPTEICAARPLLEELTRTVPELLGDRPALAVWGLRDRVFPAQRSIPRLSAMFSDLTVVELPDSNHYTPEEAPAELATAIANRFAGR